MVPRGPESAVRAVARQIREDVLALADGDLIGSEDEVVARYGVSRPTLRQAASILAQEQILHIKRGVGGGYFARIPNTRGVAQSAAVYLLAHGTSMHEIVAAVAPIKAELAALACRNDDADLRAQLAEFAQLEPPLSEDQLYWSFLRSERTFSRILGRLSGNRVLTLFLNILYDFCAQVPPDRDVYRHHAARIRAYWDARARMVDAILARDGEVAAVYAKRCAAMVAEWMSADREHVSVDASEGIALAGMLELPGDGRNWVGVPGASSATDTPDAVDGSATARAPKISAT